MAAMVSTHPTGNALGGRPARQNWGKFDAHNWGGFNARSHVLTVIGVPLAEIPSKCRNRPRNIACAYSANDLTRCTIYLPLNVVDELRDAIYEHELGHCHGWRHPQPEAPEVKMEIDRGIAVKRALTNPVCQTTPKPEACP